MQTRRLAPAILIVALIFLFGVLAVAVAGGSLSGVVQDPTGAVVPGARLTLVNSSLKTQYQTTSDAQGFYSFPAVPVADYELTIEATGFARQKQAHIAIDSDSAVTINVALKVAQQSEIVEVTTTEANVQIQLDTVATHLGEVVSEKQILAIPLNGRNYTDLLAIQPGVTPITTLTPTSVIMAGAIGTINPSGDANPGDLSIDGQRESANGFMVNGIDVQEHMNGGTSVIPNLDSIQQFRVLTNNFDAEYGNYNGGLVNVVTRSGSNQFHGAAFEFLRNTNLDAKGFFDPSRAVFRQNQFGGTLGGPMVKDKVFFFLDYQGTGTLQGISSQVTSVLSNQERQGNFSDAFSSTTRAASFTGTVNGSNTAGNLSGKLGVPVVPGECYFPTPTCLGSTNITRSVFPNFVIPQQFFSPITQNLLQFIPQPNIGANQFSTSASPETVRDNKAGARIDANTFVGQIAGYYFIDNYTLDNPYPGAQGGASIPGFDALNTGQAQEFTVGVTRILTKSSVNEFHIGLLRNVNNIGQPHGGLGVSLQSQGFVTGAANGGIVVQAPQFEGVENIVFPSFVMGVPVTNLKQWNNTLYLNNTVSKALGVHTLKIGFQFHYDQVNENPNATFNGTFSFNGSQTGNPFADFLLGFPSNFTQTSGQHFYLRNHYTGAFVQDSWRAHPNLTLNYGVRWDLIEPWSEKYNNIQTIIPGAQSVLYPNAPSGLVVPGDPGVPSTLSPASYTSFAPRVGLAYSPRFDSGILKKIFGAGGDSSIRASYGIFYTEFPGLSAGIMYGVPPFGFNYLSPAPPEFATPFVNQGNGILNPDPFPLNFPPHNVSANNPFTGFNFAGASPISADPYFFHNNNAPYTENYIFSIQRQIARKSLLTISYAGNQGHHLLTLLPTNIGNPALCLSLSQPTQVAPGNPTCGPFGEDAVYASASGQAFQGTRVGLGPNYGVTTAQKTIGNSNYNALEANYRFTLGPRLTILAGYTYSRSIDDASNLGEEVNPFNLRASRSLSSWDIPQNFVVSYTCALPLDQFFRKNRLTEGWSLSGTSRFARGFPVTLFDDSDRSLLGTLGNGVNNNLLDTPALLPGPLDINTNPRNGRPEFNTSTLQPEMLGRLGNAPRRFFHGPGIENFDMQLTKTINFTESKSLDLRVEAFNVLNHAQFYGPATVDGEVNDPNFGKVVGAATPRLLQLAAKFHF